MKVFMKLFLTIVAIVTVFAGCSARTDYSTEQYPTTNGTDTSSRNDTSNNTVTYNSIYEFVDGIYTGYTSSSERAVADFFFFNDYLMASTTCENGFASKSAIEPTDACISDSSLYTYWTYSNILTAKGWNGVITAALPVFAPKALSLEQNLQFTLYLDRDDERNIIKNKAKIKATFTTSEGNFEASFTKLQSPMYLTKSGSVTKLKAVFYDACGTVTFEGSISDSDTTRITGAKLTYKNSGSSYNNTTCYSYASYPGTSTNIFANPNGNGSSTMGPLFQNIALDQVNE